MDNIKKCNGNVACDSLTPMMLIAQICRLMGCKIREKNEDNPISQKSSRDILAELSRGDGKTQLDLVKSTHLKAPTVSVALQKLEHDGYVVRCHDENDLRSIRVYLTEQGKQLDARIRERIRREEALAMRNLTSDEIQELNALLTKIKTAMLNTEENEVETNEEG